jgi:cytochrome c-type biogenesis protein CcmH
VISRRRFLQSVAIAGGGALVARGVAAQQASGKVADTSNLFPMDQSAARSVRLGPKPGAIPSMTADERDALEHHIRCQCGCTMDVYTCRTTDFSCQVSPAMHRDVMSLVAGGYGAQEILDAFVNVYGDRALMAPPKVGFNILGYVVPGIALAIGAVVLAVVIRRWNRAAPQLASAARASALDATPEELKRLDAAIRDDS